MTPLPPAPSRSDSPAEFIEKAEAFLAALTIMVAEVNATGAGFEAPLWVSGTSYTAGNRVYSPTDHQTYRRKTNGAGTTDPSADSTNWARISASPYPTIGASIDATIAADTDNWNLSGLASTSVVRLTMSGDYQLRGIANGAANRILFIQNLGAGYLELRNEAGTSTAANRLMLVGASGSTGVYVPPNSVVMLYYDGVLSRWFVVGMRNAIKANVEAGSAAAGRGYIVTAADMQYHPGVSKFWASVSVSAATPTLDESYNVTSITDSATGRLTVTIADDFTTATWCCISSCERPTTALSEGSDRKISLEFGSQAAGSCILECKDSTTTTMVYKDPETWFVVGYGDQ